MSKVYGSPFAIDWTDKEAVIAYAKRLGKGMSVFKPKGQVGYGITHTCRKDLLKGVEIVYQT